jgi:hypothetical protein
MKLSSGSELKDETRGPLPWRTGEKESREGCFLRFGVDKKTRRKAKNETEILLEQTQAHTGGGGNQNPETRTELREQRKSETRKRIWLWKKNFSLNETNSNAGTKRDDHHSSGIFHQQQKQECVPAAMETHQREKQKLQEHASTTPRLRFDGKKRNREEGKEPEIWQQQNKMVKNTSDPKNEFFITIETRFQLKYGVHFPSFFI